MSLAKKFVVALLFFILGAGIATATAPSPAGPAWARAGPYSQKDPGLAGKSFEGVYSLCAGEQCGAL